MAPRTTTPCTPPERRTIVTSEAVPLPQSCPGCGAQALGGLGCLPRPGKNASDWDAVDLDETPTWLWRCHVCGLQFRNPVPPAQTILDRYARLKADEHWPVGSHFLWPQVRRLADRAPRRSILDVGCFRGEFLEWLGPEWESYGIEPSTQASALAESRGVRILGSNVDDPALVLPPFGTITMIDVIEHLTRPMDALRRLAAALVEGGRLVIFTGDTEALSWRISGTSYWYSAIPEHVTFFSQSWFRWAAPRLGCSVGAMEQLAHDPAPASRRLADTGINLASLCVRRLRDSGSAGRHVTALSGLGALVEQPFAWWTSARDHVLVELVKEAANEDRGVRS
jgi:SAM-dependent methyltransferase